MPGPAALWGPAMRRFRSCLAILVLAIAATGAAEARASGVTRIEVQGTEDMGSIGSRKVRRIHGLVHGTVDRDEPVAGLAGILGTRASYEYAVPFELITPDGPAGSVVVEIENRGQPLSLSLLSGLALSAPTPTGGRAYPAGLGTGYPFNIGVAYARVAWQSGVAKELPAQAQGIGQVVLRDFGRLLQGGVPGSLEAGMPRFRYRVLMGISQSAWMANTIVAEGFNADPVSGLPVYQGVLTRNGGGNVLAINAAARGGAQFPYLPLGAAPLSPRALLRHSRSAPVMVDVLAFTDFYRLRASLFTTAPGVKQLHRYAVAAPHASGGGVPPSLVFGTLGCNGGRAIALNPLDDAAYVRKLFDDLLGQIGAKPKPGPGLPPERLFRLTAPGQAVINPLEGQRLLVPRLDAFGMPLGGLPMVEALLPLGRPRPPAISPVGTRSITDVCGNFGGWEPLSAAELTARYGNLAGYSAQAARLLAAQVARGNILPADRDAEYRRLTTAAQKAFASAE